MGIQEDIERLRQYEDDDGELAQLADSLERQFEASPLRSENKELKRQAKEAADKAQRLHNYALSAAFKEVGLKVKPDVLKLPEDLDPTDTQALSAWATEAGFIESKPDTPAQEQQAHEAIQQAVAGGEVVTASGSMDLVDEINKASSPEEVMAIASRAGLPVKEH